MAPVDPKIVEFVETVYHDMKLRHTVTDVVNLSSPDRARARPYARFKKLLNVMYRALDTMHTSGFETLFTFLTLNQSNVLELMCAHCYAVWGDCGGGTDVFLHLMYTCSFNYSLLAFSESNLNSNFLTLFTRWTVMIYSNVIEPKFKAANGWDGLDTFCSSLNLHFILDFINICYNKQGKLFTYITLGSSYFFYGLHHDDTLNLLKNNFQDFKDSVFTEFESEINSNEIYKFGVMLAFIKIELAFDQTASVFNPPSPPKRLLYTTQTLFECHLWDSIKYKLPNTLRRAFVKYERACANQRRIKADQLREQIYQSQIIALEEQARAYQEQVLANQAQAIQEPYSADYQNQDLSTVEQASAVVKQTPDTVKQIYQSQLIALEEQARAYQEQVLANQAQVLAIQEPYSADYRNQDFSTVEQASAAIKQTPDTVNQIIANVEKALVAMKLSPAFEIHPSDNMKPLHFAETAPDLIKKSPGMKKQGACTVEQGVQTVDQGVQTVDQGVYTIEQVDDNVEQADVEGASAIVKQTPDVLAEMWRNLAQFIDIVRIKPDSEECAVNPEELAPSPEEHTLNLQEQVLNPEKCSLNSKEHASNTVGEASNGVEGSPNDVEDAPFVNIRRPFWRVVLIKQAPDAVESDSDIEDSAPCCCRKNY